jgi:benzoyl-CoA reductase/2-hydroxyglutaryl-CoA dehydratase subunit BcrC/BadD/HgdB
MTEHKIETPKQRQTRHKAMEAATMLDKLKHNFKEPPKAMEYFYDLHERVHCNHESLHDDTVKVGTMCIQVPSEIVHALDAQPVRLCNGFYTNDEIGGDSLPSKACPMVRATIGEFVSENFADKPDLVISPTTCDQKSKSGAIIEDLGYKVFDMEFPRTKESEESREYWRRSVRKFTKELSIDLNKKLTKKKLKSAIQKVGYAQHLYHQLNNLRKNENSPILGVDMFMVTNTFFFDKIDHWIEGASALLEECEQRVKDEVNAAYKKSPRVVYTGSPPIFPNLKIPYLIEDSDAIIVADETCSSNRMFNDMVSVDEWFLYDMVDSVADRYLKGCTCPIFTKNSDRKRRILDLVRDYKAEGVIYQAFAGCQVYEMEQQSILKTMEEHGIPILYIESDYSPSHLGQLTTRIEAFVESLKSRRRRQ